LEGRERRFLNHNTTTPQQHDNTTTRQHNTTTLSTTTTKLPQVQYSTVKHAETNLVTTIRNWTVALGLRRRRP
jgi:hypothetical protein